MKPLKNIIKFRGCTALATTILCMCMAHVHASSLSWDGNGATAPNPNGGTGTWDANTTANWWDGAANVVWPAAAGSDDDVVFGNTAGTVSLAAGGVVANDLSFTTTGYIVQSNTLTLNGTTPTITTDPGISATISSVIAGTAGLAKSGGGTLALSGANTYTAGTTVNGGILAIAHADGLGAGPVVNNATLTYQTTGITVKNAISGTGSVTGSSASSLAINSNITMTGSGGFNLAGTAGTATMSAGRTLSVVNGTGILAGTFTGQGMSITGSQTLTASGTGSLTLSGTSSASTGGVPGLDFTGATLNTSGTVNFKGTSGQSGLRFISTSGATTVNALSGTTTFTGKGTGGSGQRVISFQQNVGANVVNFNASSGAAIVLQADSTSAAILPSFQSVTADATLNVTGNVSFLGRTASTGVFWSGIPLFNVTAGSALTVNGGGDTMSNGIKVTFTGAAASATIASATATASTMTGAMSIASGTLTYNISGSGVITASGVISGAGGSLVKSGSGTLALSNTNTYTGTTTIAAGTLQLGGSGSFGNSSVIDVQSAGTLSATTLTIGSGKKLQGAGVVNAAVTVASGGTLAASVVNGAVTVANGGTLAPGGVGTIGTLTVGTSLALAGTTTLEINKTGAVVTNDAVAGTGSVSFGGSLTVTATGDQLAVGDTVTLFANTGIKSGNFSSLSLPALPEGLSWDLSNLTTTGVLTVVNAVSVPTFTPPAGSYQGEQSVTITSDSGSTIHYTVDGSDPITSGSVMTGTSPINGVIVPDNSSNFTIKAYATKSGQPDSPVASSVYQTITLPIWNVDASGLWSESAKWLSNFVPNAAGTSVDFNATAQSGDRTVTLDASYTVGNLTFGNANAINWTLAAQGSGSLTLATNAGTPTITVNNNTATLTAPLTGSQGMTKTGSGLLVLGGSNVGLSGITVSQGSLISGLATGLGNGAVTLGDASTGNSDVKLQFNATTVDGQIGMVTVANTGSSGTATLANNANVITNLGGLVLNRATLMAGLGATPNNQVFRATVSGSGAGAGNDTIIVDSGAGNALTLYAASTGANTYTGNLHVKTGTLQVGNRTDPGNGGNIPANQNLVIPDTASVTVDAGATLRFVWIGAETLDALNGAGTIDRNTGDGQVGVPFTLGAANGNGLFSGTCSAGIAMVKTGTGTQEFFGTGVAYSGATTLTNGTLKLTNTGGWGSNITVGATNAVTLQLNSALVTDSWTLAKPIAGGSATATLEKTGPGTVSLTQANTFSGATLVSAGVLQLSGSGSLSSSAITVNGGATLLVSNTSGAATVTVNSEGTLAGTGSIGAATTISNGAILAPGNNGIGSLAIGASILNGTYNCQIDGATADSIAVTGDLTIGEGSTIALSQVNPPTAASYTIATYSGTLNGTPTITGIPSGYALDITTPGQIKLAALSNYASWAATFPTLTDSSPQGDPDHDGIANILEFVTNGDPTVRSAANLPVTFPSENSLVFMFILRDDAAYLNPRVEFSSTLASESWITAEDGSNSTISSTQNADGTHTVTVTIPKGAETELFARLKVTIAP